MSRRLRLTFASALALLAALSSAQTIDELAAKVKALPHVKEVKIVGQANNQWLDITFEQPVDHFLPEVVAPNKPKFEQHVFLQHTGFDNPVILGTEGYSANRPSGGELRRMLGAPNLLTVEHRYFGRSIPNPCVWEHLTIKSASDDLHEIVRSFKRLYTGKWVSTGASKSGQTALYFKCHYPNDVDAVVAYVAPINLNAEDPRINMWMETVGDEATRARIKAFQIALLKREDEVLPLLKADPKAYSMGVAKAYEYGVLEYPYAYWQYGSNSQREYSIPRPDAPAQELADAYKRVNAMYYYSDAGIKAFEAFQYQAFTEVGYYNYDITDFKPYLRANPNPTNMDLCPPGTKDKIVYDPNPLAFVYRTLQYEAQNIIFIYGETDAWSATQMHLIGRTNAVKIVVKGAWHNASVRLATPTQQEQVYSALEKWLGVKVVRG